VAGLTGRYRTSYPRLDLPLCSDELILPSYHFTQKAISQRRTVSLRGFHMDAVDQCFLLAATTSFLILVGTLTLL
jgi:hypothetical protein